MFIKRQVNRSPSVFPFTLVSPSIQSRKSMAADPQKDRLSKNDHKQDNRRGGHLRVKEQRHNDRGFLQRLNVRGQIGLNRPLLSARDSTKLNGVNERTQIASPTVEYIVTLEESKNLCRELQSIPKKGIQRSKKENGSR